MPIINARNPSNPLDAEYGPKIRNLRIEKSLIPPNLGEVLERTQGFGGARAMAWFNLDRYKLYQNTAQVNFGQIFTSTGIPSVVGFAKQLPTTKMFEDVLDAFDIDPIQMINDGLDDLAGSVLDGVVNMEGAIDNIGNLAGVASQWGNAGAALNAVINVTSAMGPYGVIVKLIYQLGKGIHDMVQMAKEADKYGQPPAKGKPVLYHPSLDLVTLETVTDLLNSTTKDWTDVFMPPSISRPPWGGPRFGVQELADPKGMIRVSPASWDPNPKRIGFVPGGRWAAGGTPVIHTAIQVKKYTGGNYPGVTPDVGMTLYPSTLEQCSWLWNYVMGGTDNPWPAMYTIDTDRLISAWTNYIRDLHAFIWETRDISPSQKISIMNAYKPVFGWMTTRPDTAGPPDRFKPVKAAMKLRERQEYFLKYSLLSAYVDRSYAAINHGGSMTTEWANLREVLLKHEDRCEVDIANIPDQRYRQEMLRKRRSCQPFGLVAPGTIPVDPDKPWRRPGRGPEGTPPPPDGAEGLMPGASMSPTSSSKLAPVAALAALGYAGWRYLR